MATTMNARFPISSPRRISLVLGSVAAAAGFIAVVHGATTTTNAPVKVKVDDTPIARNQLEPASFADVAKRVSASVVKITVETKSHESREMGNMPDDPILRQFFGNRRFRSEPMEGIGSGVIISADGYIVTNNHVVEHADELTVSLNDGRELPAKVVGRDPQTDVAVVKVQATGLPAITFAPSEKVEVGDRVLAVGNPFGIGETVTSGIVSAKGRNAGIGITYEDFIQTDAAINPVNSGGALVDIDGRLVGMNTAILSRSGGFQGVGLAVPSDLVSYIADSLVEHGKVVRGFLGVGVQNLTPSLAESFGINSHQGAIVTDVQADGPAAKAGIVSGDVVTAINGKPIDSSSRLSLLVSETAPGTALAINLLHDGKPESVTATTITRPVDPQNMQDGDTQPATDDSGVLNGVAVDDLDPQARDQMEIPGNVRGALVTQVDEDSASARAGLKAGDVILEIDHKPVKNAKQAIDISAKATSKKTLLKIWSHKLTVFIVVDETPREPAQ